jgi:hypothetical protein
MDREYEQLSVDFTTKAQALFALTYDKFRLSTKNLDRRRDENVFQLQVSKFLATLKTQLENIAHESLQRYPSLKDTDHCNKILGENINIYLTEFRQKSKLL